MHERYEIREVPNKNYWFIEIIQMKKRGKRMNFEIIMNQENSKMNVIVIL